MEKPGDAVNYERDLDSSGAGATMAMVIETSWIKEEPLDSDDGSEGDGFVAAQEAPSPYDGRQYDSRSPQEEKDEGQLPFASSKRKREVNEDDPDYVEPPQKVATVRVKEEPLDVFMDTALAIDPHQLLIEHVIEQSEGEIDRDGESRYSTEEEEGDENVEEGEINSLGADSRQSIQKCSKCMKVFPKIAQSLPPALKGFCRACRPSVNFTCKYCPATFHHHKAYSKHVQKCRESIWCKHCHITFSTPKKLSQHACQGQRAESLLKYVCPMCYQVFEKNKSRNNHKTLHVNSRPKMCYHCDTSFPDVASYQMHRESIGESLQFVCMICDTYFESKALYDADQKRHHLQLGERHKIKPAPDFVYVCTTCKFWFKTVIRFNRHKCKNAWRESEAKKRRDDRLKNHLHILAGQQQVQRDEPRSAIPAVTENVLDAAFTCQLCLDSFGNASALGYHTCLNNKYAYVAESDSEEEEEEVEQMGAAPFQGTTNSTRGGKEEDADTNGNGANDDSNIHVKLISTNRVLSYDEVRSRPEPGSGTAPLVPTFTSLLKTFQRDLCSMCANVVQHNFPQEVCKKSSSYLCSVCLQKVGEFPTCHFKCFKCPQVFPSLERLTLHLPWHRQKKGLARRIFTNSRFSNSISPPTSISPPASSSQSVSSGTDKEENCSQPISSAKKQVATNSSNSLLTSLLNSPPTLLPSMKCIVTQRDGRAKLATPTVTAKGKPPEMKVQQPELRQVVNQQKQSSSSASIVKPLPGALPLHLAMAPGQQSLSPVLNANQGVNPVVMLQGPVPQRVTNSMPAGQTSTAFLIPVGDHRGHASPIQLSLTGNSHLKSGMLVQMVPSPQNSQVLPVQGLTQAVNNILNAGLRTHKVNITRRDATQQQSVNVPNGSTQQASTEPSNTDEAEKEQGVSGSESPAATTNPSNMKICRVTQTGSSTAEVTLTAETSTENRSVPLAEGLQPGAHATVQSLGGDRQPLPSGLFFCYGCNMLFRDITALRSHGCKVQAYHCRMCSTVFLSQEQLHSHKCPKESYVCHMCQKSCTSAEELNQHRCIESNDIRIELEDDSVNSVKGSSNPINPPSASMPDLGYAESSTTGAAEMGEGAEGQKSQRKPVTKFHRTAPQKGALRCNECGAAYQSRLALHSHKKMHQLYVHRNKSQRRKSSTPSKL